MNQPARAEDTEDAGGPFAILRVQLASRAVEAPSGQTETSVPPNHRSGLQAFESLHRRTLSAARRPNQAPRNLLYFQ
jgi:hypothetical protein